MLENEETHNEMHNETHGYAHALEHMAMPTLQNNINPAFAT